MGPEPATGVLFVCGVIFFLSGFMIVRILQALDDNDKEYREW